MNSDLDIFLKKINYNDPRCTDFSRKFIDVKLRKLLYKINQSGWCWTLFSCQGHSHKDKSYSLPYFTFIVKNNCKSQLINLISQTVEDEYLSLRFPIYNPHSLELSFGYQDENFSIVSVHWSISHLKKRGKLNELHQKFEVLADRILENNHG
jgi:hypothetical protein